MTAQMPDILVVRGQELPLCATPLDGLLKRLRRPRRPSFVATCTACWRGYVASWEVREEQLFLIDLEGVIERDGEFAEARLQDAFPWLVPPVPAKWVSDVLRCPEGALVSYRHAAFASGYERDRLLVVEQGRVQEEWLRLNPPEPIWYLLDEQGRRTRYEDMTTRSDVLEDLFGSEETPKGYRYWGQPLAEPEDDGYVLAGSLTWSLPSSGEGGV